MRFFILLLALPSALWATEFRLLQEDVALSRDEVITLTERDIVEFYEGGQSRYAADGTYSYTYRSGGTAFGTYEVDANGEICILFENGFDRCDRFVKSHGRLVMLTQKGERYPIRPAD